MGTKRISAVAGAALLAVSATASAGPMSVASSKLITPQQTQAEQVYYRHYGGYYGWDPGAAIAGTAIGLLSLGALAATGGWPYYGYGYGSPYYGGGYGSPYYGSYAYSGGPYYYGRPYYRHYGYWHGRHYAGYGRGIHTGRSVGYGHMRRGSYYR